MMKPLIVFGASGHGKVVADSATRSGWDVVGWADDNPDKLGQEIAGAQVVAVGTEETARYALHRRIPVTVGIGDNRARKRVFAALDGSGVSLATIVHPAAVVASSATLGKGTVIFAGAVVNPDAVLGSNVVINTSSSVDHDSRIGPHVQIGPGAHLGGTVTVGEGTLVGIGASIRENTSIGSWSIIGVGSVVVSDIESHVVAYGAPARPVKSLEA